MKPRIVGIGASAGGLDAIEQFISHVAQDSGLAYIVVQHLDPTQKALLPELLQRVTALPVREAEQGMPIESDCIYVIPPNTELTIANQKLSLAVPAEPRGLRLPINVLFSSLASTQGELAIGVILSGMGSDGTLGAHAIKTMGGLTLAQLPVSAQFDSMPKSAIDAGCADIVAPPDEMPGRILSYLSNLHQGSSQHGNNSDQEISPAITSPVSISTVSTSTAPISPEITAPLEQITKLLQRQTRHDFSQYKSSTLLRRIERRMAIHGITSLAPYAKFLELNPQEADLLFKEILIGVTSFFRDPHVWDYLRDVALPELLARRTPDHPLRVWSVGCSTGEEAYSLAMVFSEATENVPELQEFKLQIFASDLSPDAIASARRGQFPRSISATVSPERLVRFFSVHATFYQINKKIRDMVLFAQQDVVLDPPFTRLDLLACRNLLIYFDPLLQRKLLPLFHYSLRSGGILLLGSSETIGQSNHLFMPLQSKFRLYRRQEKAAPTGAMPVQSFPPLSTIAKELSVSSTTPPANITNNLQAAADQLLLQVYAPPALVVNSSGDIIYISGRTGKYLEPAAGKATWNFHAMAREGLRGPLAVALKKVMAQNEPLQLHGLQVALPEGVQLVNVTLQKLQEAGALQGKTMVVFHDIPSARLGRGKRKSAADASHAAQLQQYKDEIQALREEARASREELQASNEELQSTNEELQSANEELTTSKEEMQSMNEELQTINNELQTKLDDLALAQSDLQNTLNSIEIAILFLDQKLNIRRYTDRAAKIINLRESDVGRPISDLTTSLQYPTLHEDAQETLRTLAFSEKQVSATDGRWFSVRVMPYRRLDNMIDGVVITLVDITKTKELEASLREHSKI